MTGLGEVGSLSVSDGFSSNNWTTRLSAFDNLRRLGSMEFVVAGVSKSASLLHIEADGTLDVLRYRNAAGSEMDVS
jgi:hypothetical protein